MNEAITYDVLQKAIDHGVREFVICAGSRNSSFVEALRIENHVTTYYCFEERSGAFFALGRARRTGRPVAVITTSGTAVGELLPAAMEACHTGVPLLLITGDRPAAFRGSGAPQSCEQPHIFGSYVRIFQDIAKEGDCHLSDWDLRGPAHLNVCLYEPQSQPKFTGRPLVLDRHGPRASIPYDLERSCDMLTTFLDGVERPLVIVSAIPRKAREATCEFLVSLGAPVMLEGVSGLREEPRLQHLRIKSTEKVLETADSCDYPIDGVLRIGGIPTPRVWRDLEYKSGKISVCGIGELPYSGLSWNRHVIVAPIGEFLSHYQVPETAWKGRADDWLQTDSMMMQSLTALYKEEPRAEASLVHALSKQIKPESLVYLGNSLPIREWDLSATHHWGNLDVQASRGLCGIDGQISTFLGLCQPDTENWAIIGDLTALYDLAGLWVLPQMQNIQANIVIINNGGGQIFAKLFPYKEMINAHNLNFAPLADMWGIHYQRLEGIEHLYSSERRGVSLIEVVPDELATKRFNAKLAALKTPAIRAYERTISTH